MDKKFYITTAIPYVNAPPHIGHALEFVQTDVLARYHKLRGEESFLTTGADENALKNVQAAEALGISTQELVDKNAELFKAFAKSLNVEYHGFDKGSDKKTHWPGVVDIWKKAEANGDIYKKPYKGLYCVGCASFVKEGDLVDGKCLDHDTEPDLVEEENYFFRLSKYQDKLEQLIESDEYQIVPKSRKNEVLSFIRGGLEDFSISRSKERAKGWGIPVPGDESQVIYVWFDALSIYLTAIGYGSSAGERQERFKKLWPADVHVIGKDIIRFHAVYWPAILLSAGLPLPKALLVHGFITSEGKKMSKTLGNVVDPLEYIEKYGTDALRYYLLVEIPTTSDGDFSHAKFLARYNADLANGIGNLLARTIALASKVDFKNTKLSPTSLESTDYFKKVWANYGAAFAKFDLREALGEVVALSRWLDGYVEENKPWAIEEEGPVKSFGNDHGANPVKFNHGASKKEEVIYTLLAGLANISWLLQPFLPSTAKKIAQALGVLGKDKWEFEPKKIESLFPRP